MAWTATGMDFVPKNKCENKFPNSEQISALSHANKCVVWKRS